MSSPPAKRRRLLRSDTARKHRDAICVQDHWFVIAQFLPVHGPDGAWRLARLGLITRVMLMARPRPFAPRDAVEQFIATQTQAPSLRECMTRMLTALFDAARPLCRGQAPDNAARVVSVPRAFPDAYFFQVDTIAFATAQLLVHGRAGLRIRIRTHDPAQAHAVVQKLSRLLPECELQDAHSVRVANGSVACVTHSRAHRVCDVEIMWLFGPMPKHRAPVFIQWGN